MEITSKATGYAQFLAYPFQHIATLRVNRRPKWPTTPLYLRLPVPPLHIFSLLFKAGVFRSPTTRKRVANYESFVTLLFLSGHAPSVRALLILLLLGHSP